VDAAKRALRALDEAARLLGSSRSAVAKVLGMGGSTIMKISRGEEVTEAVAKRCEDYLAGLERPISKGTHTGESESNEGEEGEQEAPRPRARRAQRRKPKATAKPARKPTRRASAPRVKPKRTPKPEPESELTRAARVIEALGGIDRAERIAEVLS
jgi:hypothetical protein